MCPRKLFNRPEEHMDFNIYKKIIDKLKGVEEIALIGYGETLLYPRLSDAINYAKNNGLTISTVSNGYFLLDEEKFNIVLNSGLIVLDFQ